MDKFPMSASAIQASDRRFSAAKLLGASGNQLFISGRKMNPVKIEDLREVKTRFSRYKKDLSKTRLRRNYQKTTDNRPCARWCR